MQDIISNALSCIMNAKRAGKKNCTVQSSRLLIAILDIMKREGCIDDFREENGRVTIEYGRINECKAIKPRFYVSVSEFPKFTARYLPARDFGFLIVSTSKGLMTHREALEKNIGGSLIAYCF